MSHRALVVEVRCKPERVDDFVERATRHAALVREEPGCLRCDVLRPEDGGSTIYLYELFRDEDALAEHARMPYMPGFVEDMTAMAEGRTRTQCVVANS